MRYFSSHGIGVIIICLLADCQFVVGDSTNAVYSKFSSGISFALQNSTNWSGTNSTSLSLSTDVEYTRNRSNLNNDHFYNFSFALGFTRFDDSVWVNHADELKAQYILKSGKAKLSHSANSMLTTKFLNSFEYSYDPVSATTAKTKTSGSLVPSIFESGYGLNFKFNENSFVNFSLATARLRWMFQEDRNIQIEGIPITSLNENGLYFDYGFSLQYLIEKVWSSSIELHVSGHAFIKTFHRNDFEIDQSTRLKIKLSKYFQFRINMQVVYSPLVSYKLQLRSELLMGFYLEKAN